jgi:hypothetical protein
MCFFSFGNHSFGQEKINIKAGISVPEILHAGIRYQFNQFQSGIYVGGDPIFDNHILTISGDISYHFGGHSKFTERKPWYLRTGLTQFRSENETYIFKDLYLNFRIGRDINLSKKIGLEIDFGTTFLLLDRKSRKEPNKDWYDYDNDTFMGYTMSLGIFYRL